MLRVQNIRKEFPGTVALDEVSMTFEAGKVCALLGKNGAGKSTLVKILSGAQQPTSGSLFMDGAPIVLHSTRDAFRRGIATVYQELSLVPGMSVAENVLLGRMPRHGWLIDWHAARSAAAKILSDMGAEIDVTRRVADLGVAQQQVVEIAKAMSFQPRVLLLDEPTSALADHETEMLFRVVRRLAVGGVAVIYITHRLQELARIADTVTVLRDGKCVGSVPVSHTPPDVIVNMIFGSVIQRSRPASLAAGVQPLMEVRNLHAQGRFGNISFTLKRGEILGIAGMLGSGRTELLRALFGADPVDGGTITINGKQAGHASVRARKKHGLALVPENRKEQALILPLSIRLNVCLASLNKIGTLGLITGGRERLAARSLIDRLAIKAPDMLLPVGSLSGGNQQKIVVGKWLNTQPCVMLFDEPTRGIDLQAKQQIFRIIWDLASQGVSSIFVSSELEEVLEVCHRILVMRAGTIAEELLPERTTVEQLALRCMTGASELSGAA
jgi:ribose transport system ATP-binding protein